MTEVDLVPKLSSTGNSVHACTHGKPGNKVDLVLFPDPSLSFGLVFYMDVLILGVILQYMVSASLGCFL